MKCIWFGAVGAPSTSAVNYNFPLADLLATWNATESTRTSPVSEDIEITKLTVWVGTAPSSGKSWTFTLRDDAADTSASVTIADSATTGSWSGSVSVTALSLLSLSSTPSGTPSGAGNVWWTIEYTTGGDFYLLPGGNGSVVSVSSTNYLPPSAGHSAAAVTTATDWEAVVPHDCTVTKFVAAVDVAPGSGKSTAFSLRQNNTTDLLTATLSDANTMATTTGSAALTSGDTLVLKSVPSGTPSAGRPKTCMTVEPDTVGECASMYGSTVTPSTSAASYQQILGAGNNSWNATETTRQVRTPEHTLKRLFVKLTTAPGSGKSWAFTARNNASSTGVTVTIADAATTGSDTAHTASIGDGDLLAMMAVPTGTPAATGGVKYGLVHAVAQPGGGGDPVTGSFFDFF